MSEEPSNHRLGQSAFVGRERELRELQAGLDEVCSGRGRFFLVTGEPGIGKSRLADELAALVRQGIKTATCSALMGYEKDETPLPQKGDLSIVLDGSGNPVLVIETLSVVILSFNEVSEQFAFEEGEGDRSLAYWRMAHENYFRRNHFENRAFDQTMLVVCKRFKVVHTKH